MDIKTIKPLTGVTHCLDADDILNFTEVTEAIEPDADCDFTVSHNGTDYSGTVTKSTDGKKILLAFTQDSIALPSGLCIEYHCEDCEDTDGGEDVCPNAELALTDETKLSILNEQGCPVGYVTFAKLKEAILGEVTLTDLNFCDLFPDSEIPQGALVASDRVLTTGGGCSLKSVPQSDIACE